MIYLIKSSAFDEDNNLFFILKIGYTSDKGKDRRFTQYKLHNPSCKILYEIPELTVNDEQKIHYHFRNFRYPAYGREWYRYSEEIIDFFRNIDKYDISDFPGSPISLKSGGREIRRMVREVVYNVEAIEKDCRELYVDNIIDTLGSNLKNEDDVVSYIASQYSESSILNYVNLRKDRENKEYSPNPEINYKVLEFFDHYNTIKKPLDRLKYICECKLNNSIMDIILRHISECDNIKSYYLALGPTKLKALGYNITLIKKELGIVTFNQELLESTIYSNFHEGDKYTLSDLKEKLGIIYESISYKATAKALDILNYFEVREFKITSNIGGTKKRVCCYELLKKKI